MVTAPVVLSAAGFTAGGVAAGSVAAAAQSAIYGGFTGGVFSVLQSAGAAGIGLAGNAAIAATGATVGGVSSGLGARFYVCIDKMLFDVLINWSNFCAYKPNIQI